MLNYVHNRPREKESTEVRKSQIKGKASENSYQELKRSWKGQAHTNTRKLNRDISTGMAVFLNVFLNVFVNTRQRRRN